MPRRFGAAVVAVNVDMDEANAATRSTAVDDGLTASAIRATIEASAKRGAGMVGRLLAFARGALRAAKWLAGQKPGRYGIADMLGL